MSSFLLRPDSSQTDLSVGFRTSVSFDLATQDKRFEVTTFEKLFLSLNVPALAGRTTYLDLQPLSFMAVRF